MRHNQDVDQTAIFNSVGVAVERVRAPDTVIDRCRARVQSSLACSGRSPCSFPTDMQDLPCDANLFAGGAALASSPRQPSAAGSYQTAADLIAAAKRPAIIAGRGAVRAGARQALEHLAEQIGAILATTAQAKGLFAGNPFYVGSSGGFASPLGEKFLL